MFSLKIGDFRILGFYYLWNAILLFMDYDSIICRLNSNKTVERLYKTIQKTFYQNIRMFFYQNA